MIYLNSKNRKMKENQFILGSATARTQSCKGNFVIKRLNKSNFLYMFLFQYRSQPIYNINRSNAPDTNINIIWSKVSNECNCLYIFINLTSYTQPQSHFLLLLLLLHNILYNRVCSVFLDLTYFSTNHFTELIHSK